MAGDEFRNSLVTNKTRPTTNICNSIGRLRQAADQSHNGILFSRPDRHVSGFTGSRTRVQSNVP